MPIPEHDLPELTETGDQPNKPHIVEWVDDLPRQRRANDFDPVIEMIRQAGPGQWARLDGGAKGISPNKASSLKKQYPDIQFRQAGGDTYARKVDTA